jgi:hypothetical protein
MLMSMSIGARRHVLDQWRLIVVQQVHVIVGGCERRCAGLLLQPLFLLRWDHQPDGVEVLVSLLLGRFFP